MPGLPTTTKGSTRGNYLPNSKAIQAGFELCKRSEEAARYLEDTLREKLNSAPKEIREAAKDLMSVVRQFVINVGLSQTRSSAWVGYQETTDFQNMQFHLAEQAASKLSAVTKDVRMDYALGDNAEFLRSYSVGDEQLGKEAEADADKLFNAWLAENNLLMRGSVMYQCNDNGEQLTDSKGNFLRADAKQVEQLINDADKGFQSYLQKKGIQVSVQGHEFPSQATKQEQPESERPTSSTGMQG